MRPYLVPEPTTSRVKKFFYWASKTDLNLIAPCSNWAQQTQLATGYLVTFTSCVALASGFSTLDSAGAPAVLTPLVALAWAGFVFVTDREISGSFDRSMIWVRVVLAVILSLAIAIAMELAIFKGRVDQYLHQKFMVVNQRVIGKQDAGEEELKAKIQELQRNLEHQEEEVADWGRQIVAETAGKPGQGRTGQAGVGPVARLAQSQQEQARRRAAQTRLDLENQKRSLDEERNRLKKRFDEDSIPEVRDFVTRYEALEELKKESAPIRELSWIITLTMLIIDLSPVLMKLKKTLSDYQVLVEADMNGNIAVISAIRDDYNETTKNDPLKPRLSIADLFTIQRHAPVEGDGAPWDGPDDFRDEEAA